MKSRESKSAQKKQVKKWSADVTENSDAMDLKSHIFESKNATDIAASLKKSAETSNRRKSSPYQSAMLDVIHL